MKLISFFGLLLAVNFAHSLLRLGILIVYILCLAMISKIAIYPLCRRASAIALVFTGMVALPSLFSIVRPGAPLLRLTHHICITKQGLTGAVFLILRSFASLTLVFSLTATTKWNNILKSLRAWKIPSLFVSTLEMAHRYLFLYLELAARTFTARKSRMVGKCTNRENRRFVAAATGNLLIRTSLFGEEVYQAMLSRGYCGEARSIDRFQLSGIDGWWLGWNLVFVVCILLFV